MPAEDNSAEACAHLEQEQKTLMQEIKELQDWRALPTTEKPLR